MILPIPALAFYVFAGLAIAFSLAVVFNRNPVSSAFSLVLVFFSFAGIYAMLDAHLIAGIQVLVYAGAVMVLFVFVIMLLNADAPSLDFGRSHSFLRFGAISGCAVLLTALVWCFKNTPMHSASGVLSPEKIEELGGNTQVLAQQLFSQYLLPFELTSALLLAGLVATVAIAKRKFAGPRERESQ